MKLLIIFKEKSGIEVFWRPLSSNASALVFFSRRTDMPYRYETSLSKLNYTTGSYKVGLRDFVFYRLIVQGCNSGFDRRHFLMWRFSSMNHFCFLGFFFFFFKVTDVYTDQTDVLKDSTEFVVSVNPTGVVMWYVSAPGKLQYHPFIRGDKLRRHKYDAKQNNFL